MDPHAVARIARAVADASLGGHDESAILDRFCRTLNEAGIPVARAMVGADTLHPVLAGRVFGWHAERGAVSQEYGRSTSDEGERKWRESPFFHLESSGAASLRCRILGHNGEYPFPILADLAQEGTIGRGEAERVSAVLWYSDLRSFTRLVDTVAPDLILPLLNDYAGAVVTAVHAHGGEVLKFIGDAVLAIFRVRPEGPCTSLQVASGHALLALRDCLNDLVAVRNRRANAGLPVTDLSVALHVGEVLYGNFGGEDRLDFTVVGPAVNELARISGLSRSIDQPAILSAAFRETAGGLRAEAVSLGRFALRGVEAPQELFTLDPAWLRGA